MGTSIKLCFPDVYMEYWDDILNQANKDRKEKEKFKDITSLIIFKLREYIANLYPSYISWLPTKNFNQTKIDVAFTPFKVEDFNDEVITDKAVVLGLTNRTAEKLSILLAWADAIQNEVNKQAQVRRPDAFVFHKPSELLKNIIIDSLRPFLRQIEDEELKEEDAEKETEKNK